MFSIMTTAPSTTIPKSKAPSERRLAGILVKSRQMDANSNENGMVSATIKSGTSIEKKKEENDADQNHSFGQVVHHGMQR